MATAKAELIKPNNGIEPYQVVKDSIKKFKEQ